MNQNFIIFILLIIIICLVHYKRTDTSKNKIIQTLVRQAARWSTAAEQDNNSMIAVLHANYGAGYLWALQDIATTDEIQSISGINFLEFRDKITSVQDNATKKMAFLCPKFAPTPSILTKIGGENV